MRNERAGTPDVTHWLKEWSSGRGEAFDVVAAALYDELRRLARGYMARERRDHTLQPTALVNEAFLRLVDQDQVDWQNRAHFFGIAAQCMRRILVDHARRKRAYKRGRAERDIDLDSLAAKDGHHEEDVLAVDEVLSELAKLDERQARIVELRY